MRQNIARAENKKNRLPLFGELPQLAADRVEDRRGAALGPAQYTSTLNQVVNLVDPQHVLPPAVRRNKYAWNDKCTNSKDFQKTSLRLGIQKSNTTAVDKTSVFKISLLKMINAGFRLKFRPSVVQCGGGCWLNWPNCDCCWGRLPCGCWFYYWDCCRGEKVEFGCKPFGNGAKFRPYCGICC